MQQNHQSPTPTILTTDVFLATDVFSFKNGRVFDMTTDVFLTTDAFFWILDYANNNH
ncbi:MAG: hypothetical protein MJK14_06700 [Rivularia sp. ALOHA_DT_140]|nr:hypothetical protein [Rivularia sp. ALOHA_DT_140]